MFLDDVELSEFHDELLEEGFVAEALAFGVHHDRMRIGELLDAGRVKLGFASLARYPVADHRAQARWNISDRGAEFSCHKQSIARLCRWMMRCRSGKRLINARTLLLAFIATGAENI